MTQKNNENRLFHWKGLVSSDGNLSNPNGNTHLHLRKDTELTMKLMGKDNNYLDYTFLSHRNSIVSQTKDKKFREYLYDLHKTLDLNIDLLGKTINNWKDVNQKSELLELFSIFKQKYNCKNKKRTMVNQKVSKLLIEKQIIQEINRKIEENNDYYQEQYKEVDENLDTKEEYIKMFEKKLIEVEIYIQKITKSLVNSPFEKYKGWKLRDFLDINNQVTRTKDLVGKSMVKIKKNIENINQENTMYKEESTTEVQNTIEGNINSDENNKKVKTYIDYYRKQIRVLQMRMKLLRSSYDNMSSTLNYLYFDKEKIKKKLLGTQQDPNKTPNFVNEQDDQDANNKENQNKSILPLDMTRRINHMMDFSIILNKKADESRYDDLGRTGMGGLGNVTNLNMWDISCINKN